MITRRRILTGAAASVGIAGWGGRSHATAAALDRPVVLTTGGNVAGRWSDGIAVFKGIPYGASTAGAGRFRPPQKAAPWSGILPALDDPPEAPQRQRNAPQAPGSATQYDGIDSEWPPLPQSEDCLKLDVWTPGLQEQRRPVMVWFHGGGFVAGSAAGLWQDGGRLCRRGNVVVISVNHRLNVLGHLFVDRWSESFAGAGNAGLLDLVLALQWVRENVASFGGDAGNVTIFGQSGGGQKVSMLLAMPAATGLFHKAIIQSGPAPKALEPEYAADLAQRLLGKLAIGRGELDRLRQVDLEQIMRAHSAVFRETGGFGVMGILQSFAPVVDGRFLPEHPFHPDAPGISADVPLLIGTTRTEMTLYTLLDDPTADRMDEAALHARLSVLFGPDTQRVLAAYRSAHPAMTRWELYALISSDWPTRMYSIWIAERKARQRRAPVFMYRTDWQTPVAQGKLMSPHAIDIGFVLDDIPYTASFDGGGSGARQMAEHMSGAWLAFAGHGDPYHRSLPHWPKYDPDGRRATLLFDSRCRVSDDPDGADRQILDTLLAKS